MGNDRSRSRNRGNQTDVIAAQRGPWAGQDVFRLMLLALLIGQMLIYYDTATRAIPHINLYLLVNLALILLTLIPWDVLTRFVWLLVWPAGALMRWDWATRDTKSDVYWATSQGVYFLLHGMNPYTHVPTWVYDHQASAVNYPTYTYFPAASSRRFLFTCSAMCGSASRWRTSRRRCSSICSRGTRWASGPHGR